MANPDPRTNKTASGKVGAGSGIIWDDKGHIVTNFHVIKGAQNLAISFGKVTHEETSYVSRRTPGGILTQSVPTSGTMGLGLGTGDRFALSQRKKKVKKIEQSLFRVLVTDPIRSYQMDKDGFNFDYLAQRISMDTTTNMRQVINDMIACAPHVLLGQNTAAFLEGDIQSVVKFSSMADFEEYHQWLFHWTMRQLGDGQA